MSVYVAGLCLVTGAALLAAEAHACGDKLLVLGRHPRSQRAHGAVQRASILVLLDGGGHLQGALREMRLERDLELAGHTLRLVTTPDELAAEIRSGRHDVLMADVSEAAALRSGLLAAPGSPTLLPVIVNATGDEWAQAEADLSCVRQSPSAGQHYLAVIERAILQRKAQRRAERKR